MNMTRRDVLKTVASGLSLWLMPGAAAYFGAERAKQRKADELAGVRETTKKLELQTWKLPAAYVSQFEEVWRKECARVAKR